MPLRVDRISELRKAQQITQAQLAADLGINQNQISRYENGVIKPSMDTLALMAKMLNTSTDYLLGLSNVPYPGAEPDPHPNLSPAEREMLHLLRQYDERDKAHLVETLRRIAEFRSGGNGNG